MSVFCIEQHIQAPAARVFEVISEVEQFSQAIPHIVSIEFLSHVHRGVGTRFRETRLMHGREATAALEITELLAGERIRLVSHSAGTRWDSLFTVTGDRGGSLLAARMEGTASGLVPRLGNWLFSGVIRRAMVADMAAVKAHCEALP